MCYTELSRNATNAYAGVGFLALMMASLISIFQGGESMQNLIFDWTNFNFQVVNMSLQLAFTFEVNPALSRL